MSPGSEHSAASRLAGGPLWTSSSSGSCAPASSFNNSHAQLVLNTSTIPRSSSLPLSVMGQTFSKSSAATLTPTGPPPSPSTAQRGLSAAMAGGLRLKRAFANRRKKSEDASKMMDRSISGDESSAAAQEYRQHRIQASASSSSSPAKLPSQVLNVGSANKLTKSPLQPQLPPPPPPPKPVSIPTSAPQPHTELRSPPLKATGDIRSSIIPISPGISSAVNYMRMGESERESQNAPGPDVVNNGTKATEEAKDKEKEVEQVADGDKGGAADKGQMKDSWRKSDSTMSHHTIRAGGRPSRPVSMAESLQSNHTIVPVSKRQSALITDADFGMPEEDDSDSSVQHNNNDAATSNNLARTPTTDSNTFPTTDYHASPTSSLKTRDRRSMSLNITTHAVSTRPQLPPTPSSASAANFVHPVSEHSSYPSPPAMSPSHSRDAPPSLRTPTNASGYIAPSSIGGTHSTGSTIRGHLAAWTAAPTQSRSTSSPTTIQYPPRSTPNNPYTTFPPPPEPTASPKLMSRLDRSLPALPPHAQAHAQPRQPTISMTSGLGLAKRAVEKMHIGLGRAWGMGSGSSTSHNHGTSTSGYSSSSSGHSYTNYTGSTPPSSYGVPGQHMHTRQQDSKHGHEHSSSASSGYNELARTNSNQSQASGPNFLHKKNRLRHMPHAPSVSSTASAATSASASDSEAVAQEAAGPNLGKRLRGPMRKSGGGGVLFGRDLRSVVRDTGVGVGKPRGWGGRWRNWDGGEEGGEGKGAGTEDGEGVGGRARKGSVRRGQLKALEERRLPALVVRCAQHLLIWGVQEEGLFRVSGRPSHVSKLRAEFDNGADFDMTECSPGDLDPHAVASVFKAFLRELPEPILTNTLLPYFDAAMSQENTTNAGNDADSSTRQRSNSRGPGLPSDPRNTNGLPAMRKPPSLSTLAMPTFTGLRPPSKALLSAFRALLSQLPEENRDLIRTVAELIKATARESRETKMPLSNLLLVFCPSLNMNPPLLRVLCEAEGIWEEPAVPLVVPAVEEQVLDIRRSAGTEDGEEFEDARDGTEDDAERESLQSESVGRASEDVPSSVEYHASAEDVVHRTPSVDAGDDASSMSQPARQNAHARKASLAASSVMGDESSFLSTSEDQDNPSRHYSDVHSQSISPPLLTSSAESLDTPATSSHHASLPHLPGDGGVKQQGMSSPVIAELSPMGLSPMTPRRPVISSPILITGPVQFPSTVSDNQTPSPTKLEKRRSIPILSLPNLSPTPASIFSSSDSPTLSFASRAKRLKKPSLHLLFSKKSSSSLSSPRVPSSPAALRPVISSPYLQAPPSASDSSVSTPLSAVTAPQSSTFTLPPKLETPIDSSSLRLGVGLGIEVVEMPPTPAEQENTAKTSVGSRPLPVPPTSAPKLPAASASVTSLVPRGPTPTPIADRYYRSVSPSPSLALASKSQLSETTPQEYQDSTATTTATPSHLRPNPTRSRGISTSSSTSSNHLGLLDDGEPEDWTKSVLLAADVDSGWATEQPAARA